MCLGNAFLYILIVVVIIFLKSLITKIEKIDQGIKDNNAIVIPIIPAVAGTVISIPDVSPIYAVICLNLLFLIIAEKKSISAIPLRT